MVKGYPVKVNTTIVVPANSTYQLVDIDTVPDNESWALCQVDVGGVEDVTVADITINDNPIGLYVVGAAFGTFSAINTFGSPLQLVGKSLGVHVTNTTDQEKSVNLSLYVFKQQLYATRQA
ncbi:hypothetical protein D3C75_232830 [compost metagenome]